MKRFPIASCLASLAFFSVLFFVQRRDDRVQPYELEPGESLEAPVPSTTDPAPVQSDLEPSREREAVLLGAASLRGRVLVEGGRPIAGAEVSWIAWSPLDAQCEETWQRDDWGPIERERRVAITGASGDFTFEEEVFSELGTLLWASHPDFTAGCLLLSPEDPAEERSFDIFLDPGGAFFVRVLDGEGRPIPDAEVAQYGLIPTNASAAGQALTPERARRLLERRYLTDHSGAARLAAFPGEQVLRAAKESECSAPWRGEAGGEVVLRLGPSFTMEGTLDLPDWETPEADVGEHRLVVEVRGEPESVVLASLRPMEEGAWGPLSLPVLEGRRFDLRLEGPPIVPLVETFACPQPGSHLVFDLSPELGSTLYFFARDERGQPIGTAEAACFYEKDGVERVLRKRGRSDGYILPSGFPEGAVVRTLLTAPGYAGIWTDTVFVPELEPSTRVGVLKSAAGLRGRVVHDGRPVGDFTVGVWEPGRALFTRIVRRFHDRADGRFEMDGIPGGAVEVAASTEVLPQGDPVHVTLPSEEEVELVLRDPITGTGHVVDHETGKPVSGAEVRVFVNLPEGPVHHWADFPVDSDGRFTIAGFRHGENTIRARSPGYADRYATQVADAKQPLDFGEITLSPPRSLEVRLIGKTGFSGYTAEALYPSVLPTRAFDDLGIVRYEDVGPGGLQILVRSPQSWTSLALDLAPGRDWVFEHRVAGPRRLTIEVIPKEGDRLSSYRGLLVSYRARSGITTEMGLPVPASGSCVVEGIDAESVDVTLGDVNLDVVAKAQGNFEGKEELLVRLDASEEPFLLRVVDGDGLPVSGAFVQITSAGGEALLVKGTTGEDGRCRLFGLPERPLRAHLEHETRGRAYGLALDGGSGSAELRLSNDATIDLRCMDGGEPLSGIVGRIRDEALNWSLGVVGTTNASGLLRASGFASGAYRVSLEHPDCWPSTVEVPATESGSTLDVQLRRRADLTITLRLSNGLAVGGRLLELTSLEFQEDVEEWLARDLVRSETGLSSDIRGEVRMSGLPRGAYRWQVFGTDSPLHGELQLVAGRMNELVVMMPDE